MKVTFHAVAAAMALTCMPQLAYAQLGGTLGVEMTLTTACAVTTTSATSSLNLGTINFGSRPATFTGVVTAQPTGGVGGCGTTQIVCSPDVSSMSVTIDGGANAGHGASVGSGSRATRSIRSTSIPTWTCRKWSSVWPCAGRAAPSSASR